MMSMLRFVIALVLITALPASAAPPVGGPVQTVGEYTLYFGVLPSAITQGTPHSAGPRDAHGVRRTDFAREHHVLVVVERRRDGFRPANAKVTVSVPIAGASLTRTLAPMPVNGHMSYGTVIALPRPGRYVFDTTVRIPGRTAPLRARFAYTHQHARRP